MRYKLLLLTGFILLSLSVYKLKQSVDFINKSEQTTGTVTFLEESDGAYSPVFAVKTKDNGEIIYHHPAATNPASWAVGEEATFLYDPEAPHSATMIGYFWLFSWAIVFMAIAIPLLIIGGGYLLLNPHR